MESRINDCTMRHNMGFNCAQSVACTYADLVGCDEETMFKMTEGLGLGMGGMQGTCGALSGACVLAGMKNSGGDLQNPTTKGQTYQLSREIVAQIGAVLDADAVRLATSDIIPICEPEAYVVVRIRRAIVAIERERPVRRPVVPTPAERKRCPVGLSLALFAIEFL